MRWIFVLITFILSACSCNQGGKNVIRIGIDPTFSPLNFEEMQPYVNGYIEDVLLEVSRFSGMHFEKINANWDTLLEGLDNRSYDAIISSMPPYNFNLAKYSFSQNFLELGPVLVVPSNSHYSDLDALSGELVGVIKGDPSVLVIEKHPEVIIRTYHTIQDLLNAVANGDIEAAVLDYLPAQSYLRDLYVGRLRIATKPLTDVGLQALTLKDQSSRFMRLFNQAIDQMKKKKVLISLRKKWNLQ
jgi:polar amino acid transport system substrate-binding protein